MHALYLTRDTQRIGHIIAFEMNSYIYHALRLLILAERRLLVARKALDANAPAGLTILALSTEI